MTLAHRAQHVDAALPGQGQIEQQHIDRLRAQGFERRLTRGGLERDLEAELVGQQLAKAGTHDLVVVDDGDAQHGRRSGLP